MNVDPGTMSPYQHGEVYVTDDGYETDLDLGHYERFTDITCSKNDSISSGKIYSSILSKKEKEIFRINSSESFPMLRRNKKFIKKSTNKDDVIICEIGGTVGDIESLPFLEAIRQFKNENHLDTYYSSYFITLYETSGSKNKTYSTFSKRIIKFWNTARYYSLSSNKKISKEKFKK